MKFYYFLQHSEQNFSLRTRIDRKWTNPHAYFEIVVNQAILC